MAKHSCANPEIVKRMSYLIGHLQGVKKMIEKCEYCVDIINQNLAVMAALRKVNHDVLDHHLNTCVVEAMSGNSPRQRKKKIAELLEIFENIK